MRRILTIITSVVLLSGIFAGTWYLGSRGDSAPDTDATTETPGTGSTTPTTPGGTATTTPLPSMGNGADTNTVRLVEPLKSTDFLGVLSSYLNWNQINPVAAGRIVAYSGAAFYDAVRSPGAPSLISDADGGSDHTTASAVSARVAAALIGTESARRDVEEWAVPLEGEALQVFEDVVARANSDGYLEAGSVTTPSFTHRYAWNGSDQSYTGALEPGWGNVKPILFDIASCAPARADLAELDAELGDPAFLAAVEAADLDTARFSPVADNMQTVSGAYLASMALIVHARYDFPWPPPDIVILENALAQIAAHDLTIAIWKSKWDNGIAAPLEHLTRDGEDWETTVNFPSPAYPSWPAALAELTGAFIEGSYGVPMDWPSGSSVDAYAYFQAADEAIDNPALSWGAAVDAGREAGRCIAEQALAIRSANA